MDRGKTREYVIMEIKRLFKTVENTNALANTMKLK